VEGYPDVGDPMKREPNRSQHEWPGIPRLQSWEGRQLIPKRGLSIAGTPQYHRGTGR